MPFKMEKPEAANIKIISRNGKVDSISVCMPVWSKSSEHGHLLVNLPFLGIETFAKDELDSEKAVEEAIVCFCTAAERFGQGIEKELQALGWVRIDGDTGEPVLGYNIDDADSLLDRILQTGDNYVNQHLELV